MVENKEKYLEIKNKFFGNHLSHAYIIETNSISENKKIILSMIKSLFCCNKNCTNCKVCYLIDNKEYSDLEIIRPINGIIKKEQLLNIKAKFLTKSLTNIRIYVIIEAEKLNKHASNTILKFLEEPNENVIAFLVTSNKYKLLDTIISRCQTIILDNKNNNDIDESLKELLTYIPNKTMLYNYENIITNIFPSKEILKEKLEKLENIYYDYIQENEISDVSILEILQRNSINKIIKYVSIIEKEKHKLDYNVNYKLWLDNFCTKIMEVE